jgi:hypothetical protein
MELLYHFSLPRSDVIHSSILIAVFTTYYTLMTPSQTPTWLKTPSFNLSFNNTDDRLSLDSPSIFVY